MNKLVISSKRGNIAKVYEWVKKSLKERASNAILLVIQEAVTNSIVHGNKEDESKKVTIEYRFEKDGYIRFFLTDEGEGNIPLLSCTEEFENEAELFLIEGGRGLKLIKFYAEELKAKDRTVEILIKENR